MADIPTARISVSSNRGTNDGEDKSIGFLRRIDSNMKGLKEEVFKAGRLRASGLIGGAVKAGGVGGGIFDTLLGGFEFLPEALAVIAGIKTGKGLLGTFKESGYEKVQSPEGTDYIAKINQTTGEIVDLLTEQEAMDKGILDAQRNIKSDYQVVSEIWDKKKSVLAQTKDKIILSNELWEQTNEYQKEYNKILYQLSKEAAEKLKDKSVSKISSGQRFEESGSGFTDYYTGQSISAAEAYVRQQNQSTQWEQLGQLAVYGYGNAYNTSTNQSQQNTQQNSSNIPSFVDLAYQQSVLR